MTVYAASNVHYVAVGPDHGGCGASHRRPVVKGAPVHPWRLDCRECEDHLRHDPLWSTSVADIPETHDERKAREDYETRGAKDRDYIQAMALAKIAGVEVPETLQRVISGGLAHVPATVKCAAGHDNPVAARFCGECGVSLHEPEPVAAIEPPAEPPTARHPSAEYAADSVVVDDVSLPEASAGEAKGDMPEDVSGDLSAAHVQTLKRLAREKGLDDSGTKDEVLARLQAKDAT